MDPKKLFTLTFPRNVGTADRVFRLSSGVGVAAAGWAFTWPDWAALAMTAFGVVWFSTGALSKCSIYYLFGHSTCPSVQLPERPQ